MYLSSYRVCFHPLPPQPAPPPCPTPNSWARRARLRESRWCRRSCLLSRDTASLRELHTESDMAALESSPWGPLPAAWYLRVVRKCSAASLGGGAPGGRPPVRLQVDAGDAEVIAAPEEARTDPAGWTRCHLVHGRPERGVVGRHGLLGPAAVGQGGPQPVPQQGVRRPRGHRRPAGGHYRHLR